MDNKFGKTLCYFGVGGGDGDDGVKHRPRYIQKIGHCHTRSDAAYAEYSLQNLFQCVALSLSLSLFRKKARSCCKIYTPCFCWCQLSWCWSRILFIFYTFIYIIIRTEKYLRQAFVALSLFSSLSTLRAPLVPTLNLRAKNHTLRVDTARTII